MAYDLKITGGTVVDGTGAPPRQADVGVVGGRIVEVGRCDGPAARELHVEGAIVTPGFVDLHGHYDGQLSWDVDLAPSCLHGVTTVLVGNCGVGFAPVRPSDRQALIELMEGVEDIPGTVLAEGLRWDWQSFPEYMNAVDFPHTIDFAVQVPHDPLRVFVMGDRALAGRAATAEDIARMRALLREALLAGAAGFSTGRTDNHRARSGAPTPASEAEVQELCGLASAFCGLPHGVLQAVSDFDMETGPDRFDPEFDLLEQMAAAADGHPLSLSLLQRDLEVDQWRRILRRAEQATARGVPMRLQVAPRPIGVLLGLEATFHPFMGFPSYKRIAHLPLEERVRILRDPTFKQRLLSERSDRVAGDGSPIPPLADRLLEHIAFASLKMFRLGEHPDYEPAMDRSLCAEASRRGVPPLEVVYDALLENDGHQLLYFPLYNYSEFNLECVAQMLHHPLALLGLADGGAHVGTICDASFPTFLLSYWTRDRPQGRLPLERAVRMLTYDTSRHLGLRDRGVIAPGFRADLNVIDMTVLRLLRPRLVRDLPAGGRRLLQDAVGYVATIVRGEIIREGDRLTGARPGRLVRLPQSPPLA
ncbi:MAG: amidohydrolase family protein [Myxococcales bacterium]|nr:amidohydrolase family protein [Myxococcota bacterium]MDW8280444.1 amidohydrolase family protein [Myxococcales bacterium]